MFNKENVMAREVISLNEARRPDFTEKQISFCRDLIGMGLTRLTIVGLVVGQDVAKLDHAQVSSGNRLIDMCRKELGYGIMDARRAQSPYMQSAIAAAARTHRLRVKIA